MTCDKALLWRAAIHAVAAERSPDQKPVGTPSFLSVPRLSFSGYKKKKITLILKRSRNSCLRAILPGIALCPPALRSVFLLAFQRTMRSFLKEIDAAILKEMQNDSLIKTRPKKALFDGISRNPPSCLLQAFVYFAASV